jgi:hypothetical protein
MNVDSTFNARQLSKLVKKLDKDVEVFIRMNVDLDTKVHPYLQTGAVLLRHRAAKS